MDQSTERKSREDGRLKQQFDFLLELDKEKQVERRTPLHDNSRKENDAEHAWHMAVMAMILSEYANEDIDVDKTIRMLLIHDLVEIYAGDTYAYDEEGKKSQEEREEKASEKLFALLPKDQGDALKALFEEFDAGETPEAAFARTLDNVQPTMLNDASGGTSWAENRVRLSQVLKRNGNTAKGSEELWDYSYHHFILPHVADGQLIDDTDEHDGGHSE